MTATDLDSAAELERELDEAPEPPATWDDMPPTPLERAALAPDGLPDNLDADEAPPTVPDGDPVLVVNAPPAPDGSILAKIGQAIGAASMCWSETPKGTFDSGAAGKIVEELWTVYRGLEGRERNACRAYLAAVARANHHADMVAKYEARNAELAAERDEIKRTAELLVDRVVKLELELEASLAGENV